jgi:RNA polymerase sigma factor (sigma-70 family)
MTARFARLIPVLRRLTPRPDTDADLLERFTRHRDDSAFAALVERHGPMVLHLCRRVLRNAHDAEDACQATFLVLARKASALGAPAALAGWLYGVAHRVARKAHSRAHRQRAAGANAAEQRNSAPDPLAELAARDVLEVVEAEVQRLPTAYRMAVALCLLEGLSQEDAALRLGCTMGSLRGRLERGRKRLQARLIRRGIAVPAALAALEWSHAAALAAWPPLARRIGPRAVGGPTATAVALADRVLRSMLLSRLTGITALLLAVAAVAVGTGCFTPRQATEAAVSPAAIQDAPDRDPVLAKLIRSLSNGPIQIGPARLGVQAVSRDEAVKAAGQAVGVKAPPARAWRVVATDQEFPAGLLKEQSCWLLYYPDAVALHLDFESQAKRRLGLYVVVDAQTGRCWEAFTEPQAPWWQRVKEKNGAVLDAFAGRGDEAASDPNPLRVPLLHWLNARASAIPSFAYGANRKAQQVIARRFLYTTAVDTEERAAGAVRRYRSHDHEPVWFVEFDGVDLPHPPGPPMRAPDQVPGARPAVVGAPMPNIERIELRVSATTGQVFTTGGSP